MNRLTLALIISLFSGSAFAQGTQLNPPGFRWGGMGATSPSPGQMIGYDSSTALPCIVGSTATCSLQTSSGGGSVTVAPATGTGGQTSVTVTNTSAEVLALRVAPQYHLFIKNESASASVAFCLGACTAALNTAGSITMLPGQWYTSSPAFVPLDSIKMISSAATSPVTIQAN